MSAIAVFANFTLVVPQVFTLVLYFLAMSYLDPSDSARTLFRRVCWLAIPLVAILGFWCGEAIVTFRYETLDWNAGGNSFAGTLHSMFVLTFQDPNPELLPSYIFATLMWLSGSRLPYVYGAIAVICLTSIRQGPFRSGQFIFLLFAIALFLGLVVFYIGAHAVLKLPFPFTRTALPLIVPVAVSFCLLCLGSWRLTQSNLARRSIDHIGACLLAFDFISSLHFNYIAEWKSHADIATAIKIAGEYAKTNDVREVATDPGAIAAARFYRDYYGYGFDLKEPPSLHDGFEIYLISPDNQRSQAYFHNNKDKLTVLFRSPESHLAVAAKRKNAAHEDAPSHRR